MVIPVRVQIRVKFSRSWELTLMEMILSRVFAIFESVILILVLPTRALRRFLAEGSLKRLVI